MSVEMELSLAEVEKRKGDRLAPDTSVASGGRNISNAAICHNRFMDAFIDSGLYWKCM